ncbi:DUF484 family protein [Chiayiivirga flava]|uniref:DUF484 family protein n=1 Tax=Chiayiivirga flava TaxID=659595 RepID=A0A7W8D5Z5_9GAMM|nr:DUF484 family protein [Chiayiivirga flava]MBB5207420.1 hypothetical protein [Chiayiivirga flava]
MSDVIKDGPGANEVAAYLRRHPRFLHEFPDLALSLAMPRDEGQATSLASYQLDVLRDKNRELNRRLQELFTVANENERLTVRVHQLTLALLRAGDLSATLRTLVACLTEDFRSELVRVLLFRGEGLEAADWLRIVPADDPALQPFAEFRQAAEPLCGRLQDDKMAVLFGARALVVNSTALMPVGTRGMLAIGSTDPNRFYPGMGTLFLRLMAEALDAALARFDA